MDNIIKRFSGRDFSSEDIELIKWTRKHYPGLSRSELAATICQNINWITPAGKPKSAQCSDFLSLLESEGIIDLPKIQSVKKNIKITNKPVYKFNTKEISGDIKEYLPITLTIARPDDDIDRWRSYVDQYHMLGDKRMFGSRLKYFVKSGETELGCIQFSASAWALEERDNWINWTVDDRTSRLHLIINNSRFLVFPWVNIRNLASKTLAIAAKQIQEDWLREYCYAPVLLETFVDSTHFKGTCYKAANWIYIGDTKGDGRKRVKKGALSRKLIFMYPLQDDFKEILRGDKPCKVVDPDD